MTRADQRKFHYIYKITRFDGKYYIGMHSTDDLEDGYFGSGHLLWKSIKKHGKEKHSKEILEFLSDRKTLKLRERALVNEEIVNDPLCMNLQLGGGGGFISEEHQRKCASVAGKVVFQKYGCDKWRAAGCKLGGKSAIEKVRHLTQTVDAQQKRKTTLEQIKHQQGENNSQFGTCWVTNGTPIKIKKEQLDEYLANGYRRGRK